MPNLAFNPTPIMNEKKRTNELLHNQPAQKVFPYQTNPDQVLPYVPQQQNNLGLQSAPLQTPERTTAPAPALAPPEYKAPTFDASQIVAVAGQQPPPPPLDPKLAPRAAPEQVGVAAPAPTPAPRPAPEQVGAIQPPAPAALPTPPVAPTDVQPVPAVPGGYQPGDLQQQVLEAGQQTVLEGFQSPVTDLTSQLTQKLLQDPTFGRDFEETMRRRMAGYDVGTAQSFEKARQATAPISQTGANIEDLQMLALSQGRGRAEFGTELEEQEYNRMLQDTLSVLGAGREASEMERLRFATDVGSIAQMTGAAEGTEQRLFEAQENAINRGMEFALQANNESFQFAITELQGKIDQGIQLTKNDFIAGQNELDRELSKALQSGDIAAQSAAIQMQLDYNKWQTEAGFEFTAEQKALDRGLSLSLQTGDQVFQEKMLGLKKLVDLDLMVAGQTWQGIQSGLDRQMQQAIAEGNWKHAIELQNMKQEFQDVQQKNEYSFQIQMEQTLFSRQKWLQDKADKLVQLGWTHEEAMQQAEHEQQTAVQEYEWMKKELMQQNIAEDQADIMAQEYALKTTMQTTEHIFQAQVEANKITLEESKLAQQASQFTSELEFQEWAKTQDIDLAEAQMAWKTSENAIGMAHEMKMQDISLQFAEKGMDLQIIMSNLESMPPDQAAAAFNQIAIDAGFTYQEQVSAQDFVDQAMGYSSNQEDAFMADALAQGITEEEATAAWNARIKGDTLEGTYGVTKQGLKPSSGGMKSAMQTELDLNNIYAKIDDNQQLTPEEYQTYKDGVDHKDLPRFGGRMVEWTQDARDSSSGKRAWRFTNEAWDWLGANTGATFQGQDGEIYKIVSVWEPGTSSDDKKKSAFVTLESMKDGSTIKWNYWDSNGTPMFKKY